MVADILRLMGQPFNKKILDELIEEVDADSMAYCFVCALVDISLQTSEVRSKKTDQKMQFCLPGYCNYKKNITLIDANIAESGRLEFEEFVTLAAKFIVEEDAEALEKELREAFRLYDKEGLKTAFIRF